MSVYRVGTNKSSINNFPSIRPSLDLDFANTKTLDPRITFTRASSGSYFGADGILKYAGVNEARFDHDPVTGESLGLLIEEQRTNSIRNNTMVGAVVGTPGTAPTNWGGNTTTGGITRQIVGTGIEDGINYIDYRIAGTTTSALFFKINPELFGAVAATNGQTWTFSSYARLIAGSLDGFTQLNFYVVFNNSSGDEIQFATGGIAPTSAALGTQRFTRVATASNATTAFVQPTFQFQALSGASIDITLRIGLPQLEQGAFATSVIPTTTSSRTRFSDVVKIVGRNFSDFYNKNEGTIVMTYRPTFNGVYQKPFSALFSIENTDLSSSNIIIGLAGNNNSGQLYFLGYGNLQGGHFTWLSPPIPDSKVKQRVVVSYTDSYVRLYQNELTFSSSSPIYGAGKSIPNLYPTITKYSSINHNALGFGNVVYYSGPERFNCTIQNFKYYPKELGNEMVKNLSRKVSP